VPVQILAARQLGLVREQDRVAQRRAPVVLPGQRIGADRVGQRAGDVDLEACVNGEQAGVEGYVVAGAGGQAVVEIQAPARSAVLRV
jgi:hypothetical protein